MENCTADFTDVRKSIRLKTLNNVDPKVASVLPSKPLKPSWFTVRYIFHIFVANLGISSKSF